MALSVTGFPLEFDAVVNTDNLATGIQSVKDNLQGLTDPLKAALDAVDKNLATLLSKLKEVGGDPALEQLFTKYADLQKQALTFQDELSKATSPADVSRLNEALANTKSQIEDISKQISSIGGGTLAPKIEVKAQLNDADLMQSVDAAKAKLQELMVISTDPLMQSFTHANSAVEVLTENLKNLQKARENATPEKAIFLDKDIANTQEFLDAAKDKLKNIADQISTMPQPVLTPKVSLDINKDQFQQQLDSVDVSVQALLSAIKIQTGDVNPVLQQLILKFGDLQKQAIAFTEELNNTTDPDRIKELNDMLAGTARELNGVASEIQAGPDGEIEKTVQAYTRLRQIKQEMASIPSGSQQFQDLQKEAARLQESIDAVNKGIKIASTNEGGLKAIGEGVRGLIGGFQALAGAITLMGGSSEETDKATKAVIGAMGVLNGLQEVAAVLDKNSAANIFLKSLAHKENTAAIVEETVAQSAQVAAEEAGVVATEAATAAQTGLNAAMLANPVGLILGSLVAIYAAYELYVRTIGQATDAEKERAAAIANTKEVTDKAIDSYAKEEAKLITLVATSKSDLANRKDKQKAIEEINSSFPEYLSSLNSENVSTEKGNALIQKQIELIKAKATAQAASEVFSDKLKDQLKAQADFDAAVSKIQSGDKSFDSFKAAAEAQEKLKDATRDANIAFDEQTNASQKLAGAHKDDVEKLNIYVKSLNDLIAKSDGVVQAFAKMAKAGAEFKLQHQEIIFDPAAYDREKQKIIENAQARIDLDKKSFDARKNLIEQTYELELGKINLSFAPKAGEELSKSQIEERARQTANLYAKYFGDMQALNEEQNNKNYQSEVAAAEAIVLLLQAKGKEGTDAFYNARIAVAKAISKEQLAQENLTAGEIKKINAQLAESLAQIDVDRNKKQLENQRDGLQAKLNLAKEGSQQEYALKASLISLNAKIEQAQLSQSEQEKARIQTDAAKKLADLNKSFIFQNLKDEEDARISGLNAQLAGVEAGSKKELDLKKQLVVEKALLDIISANNSISSEKVKLAKIAEINAKSLDDRRKLEKDYQTKVLNDQLEAIQNATSGKNASLDLIVNDKTSTSGDIFAAKREQIQNEISGISKQMNVVRQDIITGTGNAELLEKKFDALQQKYNALLLQLKNLDGSTKYAKLQKTADDIDELARGFGALAQGAQGLDADMAKVVGTLSNVAAGTVAVIDGFKKMKEAEDNKDTTAAIGAGIGMFGAFFGIVSTINNFLNAAAQKRAQFAAQDEATMVNVQKGEIAVNDEYRKRLLLQAQLNKLKFEGIKAEMDALQANKQSVTEDYDRILKLIQAQGKIAIPEGFTAQDIDAVKQSKALGLTNNLTKAFDAATSLANKSFDELNKLFLENRLDQKASELFQTLKTLKDQGVDIDSMLEENKQKAKETFTATTSDNILDSIVKGFAEGKRATADFADNFEDLMRQSILNSFKYQALQKPIQDFYDSFAAATQSDNQLTQAEIQTLQQQYDAIIANAGIQFDQLSKLTKIDLTGGQDGSDGNSLKGAIKGITEQQAELLAGQFGGLRITALSQLDVARESLMVLNKIENNTSRIANVEGYLRKFDTDGIKIK